MNNQAFQAFDLVESFREGGRGYLVCRVVDHRGNAVLDESVWEVGRAVCEFLQNEGVDVFDLVVLRDWRRFINKEFSRDFLEQIQELSKSPNFSFIGGDKEGFLAAWAEYGWVDKIRCALEFFDQVPLYENPGNYGDIKGFFLLLSALAVLGRIDDASISEFLDGSGLSDNVADIHWFSDRINPPKHVLNMVAEAKKSSRIEVSKAGQDKRHAENRAMKHQVFVHLDQEFSKYRSMDQAAEAIAGKLVPVTFRTVREWVAEWRKVRPAGKP